MKVCRTLVAVAVIAGSLQGQGNGGLHGKPGDNRTATADYLKSITWADALPYSSATFYVKSSPHDSALIKVVPAMGTQNDPWKQAMTSGKPGYFTARIDNLEHKRIPALNMNAEDTGYLWVGARSLASRGAAIYVVRADGSAPRHRNKKFVGFCSGQHDVPRVRSTEGYDCPGGVQSLPKVRPASMRSMFYLGASGLWVSCRGGCCEVRMTE
jgi:hypothetical protein